MLDIIADNEMITVLEVWNLVDDINKIVNVIKICVEILDERRKLKVAEESRIDDIHQVFCVLDVS